MSIPVRYFAIVTLTPAMLLLAGGIWGGGWVFAALGWMILAAFAIDELAPEIDFRRAPVPLRGATALSVVLALAHFALLFLAVRLVSGAGGGSPGPGMRLVAFLAFGLFFGQVSNANAHELIHRRERGLFRLGEWVFISLLFGHHVSAHRLVHHVHVATDRDPNTARAGESFYHFLPRAWFGSFREGLRAEAARRGGRAMAAGPYARYLGGALALLALSWRLAGWPGVAAHLALAGYATVQILLSDYVQHYGLSRALSRKGARGRRAGAPEAVSAAISWDAPQRISALFMLNAPRHSDHHMHPARPYPALELPDEAGRLPHPLAIMGALALCPRRWRQVMDARLARRTRQ